MRVDFWCFLQIEPFFNWGWTWAWSAQKDYSFQVFFFMYRYSFYFLVEWIFMKWYIEMNNPFVCLYMWRSSEKKNKTEIMEIKPRALLLHQQNSKGCARFGAKWIKKYASKNCWLTRNLKLFTCEKCCRNVWNLNEF